MLKETQIPDFIAWAKVYGVEYRKFEVQRALRAIEKGKPAKQWRLLFKLFILAFLEIGQD